MPRTNVGRGGEGLKGRPQMTKDVLKALSPEDREERARKNLARNIRRVRAGMKAQTLSEGIRSFRKVLREEMRRRSK